MSTVFDREAALARMGGDERLLHEMIEYFLGDVEGLLTKLHQAIHDRRTREIERTAHTLKGLASNFGAARTIRAAWIIETLGHSEDCTGAGIALVELKQAVEELCSALRAA